MPKTARKRTPAQTAETPSSTTRPESNQMEMRSQSSMDKLSENKWVAMVVDNFGTILLVAAAFLIGMLFTEVRYLKQGVNTAAAPAAQQAAAPPPAPAPVSDEVWNEILKTKPAMEIGKKDAKVTLVEFTDYQCPFCENYYTNAHKQLMQDYVNTGKVRLLLFDYPLSFHANAKPAAQLAHCVGEQVAYEKIHNVLFEKQTEWSSLSGDALQAKFGEYAQAVGANRTTALSCVKSNKYSAQVDAAMKLGEKAGVSGTPSFLINKELVVGAQPFTTFKAAIDKNLK